VKIIVSVQRRHEFIEIPLNINVTRIYAHNRYRDSWGKGKGNPYSITERRLPELIPVLGSQPAGDMSYKPNSRLPLLSAMPAVTPATLKRAAANIAAW